MSVWPPTNEFKSAREKRKRGKVTTKVHANHCLSYLTTRVCHHRKSRFHHTKTWQLHVHAWSSCEEYRGKCDQWIMREANRSRVAIQRAFLNVPNAPDLFSDPVRICLSKLRQLHISLDFVEGFLSGGCQNLQVRHHRGKGCEIKEEIISVYQSDRGTDKPNEARTLT